MSGDAMGLVAVVGLVLLTFALSAKLARRMMRGATRADTLEAGIPASALIVSMGETGTTVNQHPLVEFGLRVMRPGQAPYDVTIRQILPRLRLGQVRPGLTVGVKVGPADPTDVAIDWDAPVGEEADGSATVPEGMFAGAAVGDTVDSKSFLARAQPASAEILHMSQTGMTVPDPRDGGEAEVFGFVVAVHRDGCPSYEAKLLQGVPRALLGRVGPGATVPVGVNPDDAGDVAIDWGSYGLPS